MEQKQSMQKNTYSDNDVIPALLSPDYIINNNAKTKAIQRPYPDPLVEGINDIPASDMVIREKLHYAIDTQHIDLFMQPIVMLPQRHVALYELFGRLRIKAGQYLPASDYIEMANEEHIISQHDAIFLTNCLKAIKKYRLKTNKFNSYFINIKPFTLRNNGFISKLVSVLSSDKDIANALIFEMHYKDFIFLSPVEKKILDELSKIGCRFSLDHVLDIPINIKEMMAGHISFIKIEANILLKEGLTEQGFQNILNKKRMLKEYNIDLIVEKIESEAEVIELLDYDIKYGQGFLFGRPDFSGIYT